MAVRLVVFDALHTLLAPRLPIPVQYAQTFAPYLGALDPDALKRAFKTALGELQAEKPVYQSGAQDWWAEVIRRTAVGAGADPERVDGALGAIVPRLMQRFSSREGYRLHADALPALLQLREAGVRTALVSNTDSRMRGVLADLGVLPHLDAVLLSEEEGVEKPSRAIFARACARVGVRPGAAVHVGDDLRGDYYGARDGGLAALLVRRPGAEGEGEAREAGEDLRGVDVVPGLLDVVEWVRRRNAGSGQA